MINIPFEDVITQFQSFLSSPIIAGYIPWILGIGAGAFAARVLVKIFLG